MNTQARYALTGLLVGILIGIILFGGYQAVGAAGWVRTPHEDGSVTLQAGKVLPRRATDIRVTSQVTRAATGQPQVTVRVDYCLAQSLCDLPKR